MRNSFDDFVDRNISTAEQMEVNSLLEQSLFLVNDIFGSNEEKMKQGLDLEVISAEKITELREVLDRIPHLVINFDDTITEPPLSEDGEVKENQTIVLINSTVAQLRPDRAYLTQAFFSKDPQDRSRINSHGGLICAICTTIAFCDYLLL